MPIDPKKIASAWRAVQEGLAAVDFPDALDAGGADSPLAVLAVGIPALLAELARIEEAVTSAGRRPRLKDAWPPWFIHGEHADGFVDVSDGGRDVLTRVRRDEAEAVIAERQRLVDVLYEIRRG